MELWRGRGVEADREDLVGGEELGPLGEGSGDEARPPPRKKMNFSLEMACFGEC